MLNYFLLNNQIDRRHKHHSWLRRAVRLHRPGADPLASAFEPLLPFPGSSGWHDLSERIVAASFAGHRPGAAQGAGKRLLSN